LLNVNNSDIIKQGNHYEASKAQIVYIYTEEDK